jgi:hypothetical protein
MYCQPMDDLGTGPHDGAAPGFTRPCGPRRPVVLWRPSCVCPEVFRSPSPCPPRASHGPLPPRPLPAPTGTAPARSACGCRAVPRVALTGRIGKPLITLHGALDALLPRTADSDMYARMVDASGRGGLHRVPHHPGRHARRRAGRHPSDRLRPVLPCCRSAFDALVAWVERGVRPPADRTVGRPASGDVVGSCALDGNGAPGRQRFSGRAPCG